MKFCVGRAWRKKEVIKYGGDLDITYSRQKKNKTKKTPGFSKVPFSMFFSVTGLLVDITRKVMNGSWPGQGRNDNIFGKI